MAIAVELGLEPLSDQTESVGDLRRSPKTKYFVTRRRPCIALPKSVTAADLSFVRRRTDPGAPSRIASSGQLEDTFYDIIMWLVVGGVIGWAASAVMRTQEGLLLNVVVGIVGAALGGVSTINQRNFSAASLVVSFLGAIILLAIVNLMRRSAPR